MKKNKTGIIMGIKEYRSTGGNAALLKDYHHKSDSQAQWQINFLPYEKQIYAFDYLGSGNHGIFYDSEYYPSVNGYDFRYKSVECFKTDKVIVDFGSYLEIETYKLSYDIFLERNKKSAFFKSLEFSPSDNISLFNALDNHLYSNLAQYFIGGASAFYYPTDKKNIVKVRITNFTSQSSLILHITDVINIRIKNYPQFNRTFYLTL